MARLNASWCGGASFAEKMALAPMLILMTVLIFGLSGLAFGIGLGAYTFIAAALILCAACFFLDRGVFRAAVLSLGMLALWMVVCGLLFDWSYDGMYYHKQAVITLKEGWNPFYERSQEADVFATYPDMALWLDNYPKGLWIFSAVLYGITNLLETAKAVNLLFLIPVFSLGYDVMRTVYRYSKGKSFVFAAVFVLNPVFLCQIFTFYNDLAVGALVFMAALCGIKIVSGCANRCTYTILFCTAAFSCTVKFTAPILIFLILAVFGVYYAIQNRRNLKKVGKPVLVVFLAFLAGVVLLGADPYMKHIAEGQHILFPVMGEGSYDIMNTNPPAGFEEKNSLQQLFASLFSKTSNDIAEEPQLKLPFTFDQSEWQHLANADIRIGGFGILFSGILVLSLGIFAASLLIRKKIEPPTMLLLLAFILLTLFFPESWWARYTSYTYYIPVFFLVYAAGGDNKPIKVLRYLASGLFVLNSVIIFCAVLTTGIKTTKMLQAKLAEIRSHNQKVIVRVNDFPSHVKLFSEAGIDFEVSHEALPDPQIFYRNTKYQYAQEEDESLS